MYYKPQCVIKRCQEYCEGQRERPLQSIAKHPVPDVHICIAAFFNGLLLYWQYVRKQRIQRKGMHQICMLI